MTVPNSWGSVLQEVNHCHGKGKGHPCTGGSEPAPTVDEHGVTNVGDFVELYHGTSARRAKVIAKEGFRARVRPQTMPGDSASSRDYVWLAKRRGSAEAYSAMHANPAVVTVRIPARVLQQMDPYRKNSGPDSVWVKGALPAKYIHTTSGRRKK